MAGQYFFGIDGGGTHSRIAITDREGKILSKAEGGSTNIYSVSRDEVFANLSLLLERALSAGNIEKKNLTAGCIGSAGLARNAERKLFRRFFDALLGENFPVKLCNDGEILLCGGIGHPEGYCLIAGTGSIALGRSLDGRLVRAGGHGYMLGDEGSASWIGKTAIARILRSMENRDLPTDMLESILDKTGIGESGNLIQYVHHDAGKAEIAGLAPVVADAAGMGDPLAADIIATGARELALLVKSVVERSPWINRRELVLAGGVMEHSKILSESLKEILTKENSGLAISAPKGTALEGACLLALT